MEQNIPESDWQLFARFHKIALDRFCHTILEQIAPLAVGSLPSAHERYLKVWGVMEEGQKEIARLFNDYRRSTALQQLALICNAKAITEEEFAMFSEETRRQVRTLLEIANRR